MACNSGTCQSGSCRDEFSAGEDGRKQRPVPEIGNGSDDASPRRGESIAEGVCIKCKVNGTIATTHPAVTGSGGDAGRFCADCFRSNLFGKFRFAVTSNAMISPTDNVLVAFSGGSSSRVALQFVHEMQQKAQKNFDATKSTERVLPVFRVGVAYIDETTVYPVPSNDFDRAVNEMERIVSSLTPPEKQFFVVPTENIYSTDFAAERDRLTKLVDAVSDVTGKQDLMKHLRMSSLQKAAYENGYTKIVMGTCTSQIACHVLEATVKGQGFSLAADIQYVDARWKIPVVLPLRDCPSEELNMLCSLDRFVEENVMRSSLNTELGSLKTVESLEQPRSGINGLISSFVKLLQVENPSRESTIVRTAGKLTPFSFNTAPEVGDVTTHLASKRRQKKYNLKPDESLPTESFCLICNSPLKKTNDFHHGETHAEIYSGTCSSCQFQILPKDNSSMEYFCSLLPQSMTTLPKYTNDNQKLLREQIQDCLLSESDDGTS